MNQPEFKEEEIPYHILNRFGLTQEMIEDLPDGVSKKLHDGGVTPVLPIKVIDENGDAIQSAARLSLFRNSQNEVRVMFYPRLEKADISRFPESQQKLLEKGEPVIAEKALADGSKTPAFFQLDFDTNQLKSVPVAVVDNNLKVLAEELHLTQPEINCLRNGKLLTTSVQEDRWTVGVTLRDNKLLRVVSGDEEAWREDDRRDYGKFNFGLNGCWIADDQGGLDYVPEEEYSEDLWDEMKKRGNQLRNAASHKM